MKVMQNKSTQHPVAQPLAPRHSLSVAAHTVPHPMDSTKNNGDRPLVMVWRATGEAYPKMEAHWVYADEL